MNALGASPSHDVICGGTTVPISVIYVPDLRRVYVEPETGSRELGGCATLTQIWEGLPEQDSPLYAIDAATSAVSEVPTGTWLLTEDLYVEDGITLIVAGAERGGDADELRLLSNSETFLNLRGNGGSLAFDKTRVLSWDNVTGGPDEDISDGRSYVSCLSEVVMDESLSCAGRAEETIGECRMDIHNSEMAYLGYDAPESWGLSSIVRGFCSDKSNPEVFDSVSARGTIYESDLHHNYHGYYTVGNLGGDWKGNTVHDNFQDGLHAHEHSRGLMITGNDVRNNGNNGIVGVEWCSDLSIFHNVVQENRIGVFLFGMGDRAKVELNRVQLCSVAGIAILESSHGFFFHNALLRNTVNVLISGRSEDNVFDNNVIRRGGMYDIFTHEDAVTPFHHASGRPNSNIFSKNKFGAPRRAGGGVHIVNSDGIQFVENSILRGPWPFTIQGSEGFVFSGNHGYDRIDVSLDSESCVDPVSDFGETVCKSSNAVLYRPGVSAGRGQPADADVFSADSKKTSTATRTTSSTVFVESGDLFVTYMCVAAVAMAYLFACLVMRARKTVCPRPRAITRSGRRVRLGIIIDELRGIRVVGVL